MGNDRHDNEKYLGLELKTHGEWSHNQGEAERRMVILVELLARRAAENDFKELHAPQSPRYLH